MEPQVQPTKLVEAQAKLVGDLGRKVRKKCRVTYHARICQV